MGCYDSILWGKAAFPNIFFPNAIMSLDTWLTTAGRNLIKFINIAVFYNCAAVFIVGIIVRRCRHVESQFLQLSEIYVVLSLYRLLQNHSSRLYLLVFLPNQLSKQNNYN